MRSFYFNGCFNSCRPSKPNVTAQLINLRLLKTFDSHSSSNKRLTCLNQNHISFNSIHRRTIFNNSSQEIYRTKNLWTNKIKKEETERKNKKENIYTIPNLVTCSRILLCPLLSYTIINDLHLMSSLVLIYCGTSDWLDGKLARMYPDRMASVLGSILDPAADKILMTTLVISLSLKSLLPLPLAFIIIGRDFLLSLSSFYFRYQSLPNPKTLARFWDLSLPSAQVKPTLISKYNTFLQLILVGLTTITPILPMDTTTPLFILQWTVAFTTISSGLSYVFSKNVIKYIR